MASEPQHSWSVRPESALELLEFQEVDPDKQAKVIHQLSQLGVKLAIDDLGSGYSSLRRLASLPFDTIKIDQGLLTKIRETPQSILRLMHVIIQMGQDFECEVVVEGLEDLGMIEVAMSLGVLYGQGYGLARPMRANQILAWCRDFRMPSKAHSRSKAWWPERILRREVKRSVN